MVECLFLSFTLSILWMQVTVIKRGKRAIILSNFETGSKNSLAINISKERNMFVLIVFFPML